ncbi:2,4'-dihydroxyacetophenone dioxygenase family protein [Alicyclobacillus cycloheptanicus]|uniref:Quercetin dioxygenase-like cupin family protein n=1 Tax=Alicyclobacillus cycloheptanicus TaxID=1457 RepID=A0ABT9XMG6_9BACL|nr:2,4'-dihydroxyacetophenone dioxygenase family protein [Alicyclobacillus cycloheptanicus]MDQ0191514.1 quercetin dioxygenase-like cupin family protein [Alicyclobacillus cycloheptanicus]WDM00150.1 2,4'-dihydroxyacetophenone dioxygenase family protein [Alicyclobacillus cycloheptanicus]
MTGSKVAKPYEVFASYVDSERMPWFEWVPGHWLKLCKLNPISGQMVLFIKSRPGTALPVHFHSGTVIVYTVQGEWTYDEGWVAKPGDVIYELSGSTHSPRMVGKEDTIVFAIIEGSLEFRDDDGNKLDMDNWQTMLKRYHDFCSANGIEPVDITRFD